MINSLPIPTVDPLDFVVALLAAVFAWWFLHARRRRRQRELAPFPAAWQTLLTDLPALAREADAGAACAHPAAHAREFLADVRSSVATVSSSATRCAC